MRRPLPLLTAACAACALLTATSRAQSELPVDVLLVAVKAGDVASVREILDGSPSLLNKADARHGATPLHWAALKGHLGVVRLLLERGAVLEARNAVGETPLTVAERADHRDVAEALRAAGAQPQAGSTARAAARRESKGGGGKTWLLAGTGLALAGGTAAVLVARGGDGSSESARVVYDGTWRGSTSQGQSLVFTVVGNAVTALATGFVASSSSCTVTTTCPEGSPCANLSSPAPISGNAVTVNVSNSSVSFTLRGNFSSATLSSGTVEFTLFSRCGALPGSASWNAAR